MQLNVIYTCISVVRKTSKYKVHISDVKITGGATLSMQKTYMSNISMLLLLTPPTCICSRSAR